MVYPSNMRTYLSLTLTILTSLAFGQVNNRLIKEQAELTASALLHDNYEALMKFTYPKIVEMVGGRDKMVSMIKKGKVEMGQQGISFERVIIGQPSTSVKAGSEIHCLVPQTIFMKVYRTLCSLNLHLQYSDFYNFII
jgi:hypothetical protein